MWDGSMVPLQKHAVRVWFVEDAEIESMFDEGFMQANSIDDLETLIDERYEELLALTLDAPPENPAATTGVIFVQFEEKSGVYAYPNKTYQDFANLKSAPSITRYINTNLRVSPNWNN